MKSSLVLVGLLLLLRNTFGFTVASGGRRTAVDTALSEVRNRGLEVRRESATPTEGGMTLYLKPGPDGTSAGDCPFAHFVRMVLEEKGLEYKLRPSTQETKPDWLVDYYDGKLPALQHRKECYVESDVIAQYLDYFFPQPPLSTSEKELAEKATEACDGFFPSVARYLKYTPDGEEGELKEALEASLQKLADHLESTDGDFLCGEDFTMSDCSLAPKLFHLQTGLKAFKDNAVTIPEAVAKYTELVFARPSFVETRYPEETIVWGWGNARN